MGRPKGSTWNTDLKILLALLYKPRKFSEFEYALVNEFCQDIMEKDAVEDPKVRKQRKLLMERCLKRWKIPRRSLARRLKQWVAKGWVRREILRKHGHHVVYSLDFSKVDEILEVMPKPEMSLKRSEKGLIKTAWVSVPLRKEFSQFGKLSIEKIVDVYLRLKRGEFICPDCLRKGQEALNVHEAPDGRFYCRNCGKEVTTDECNKLLGEIMSEAIERDMNEFFIFLLRFLKAINEQLKRGEIG